MSRRKTYWTLQFAGWGVYSTVGAAISLHNGGPTAAVVIGYGLYFLYSIGLTNAFRQMMKRGRWLETPGRRLWLRLAAGVLGIAAIQFVLVLSFSAALHPGGTWPREAVFYLAWGTTFVTATWTGLYVRLTEKRRQQEREVALQLTLREAELRALQRQVNPHFLFNCLNSIRALIIENPARAQEMVTRLADMLRYNLQRDVHDTVPLASEMKVVTDYLALEGVRFEERLRVSIDVDPSLGDVGVPALLLPTLVENAVTHGIAAAPTGGDIEIQAIRDAAHLRIEVTNTGRVSEPRAGSTGLANIRERLRMLYGDAASLTLTSSGHDQVVATVVIPFRA